MKPEFDKNRALSWSAISSFEWDKEQWYESYILGKRQSSKEMDFGSLIDKKIQDDPTFLPMLTRYPLMQHKMSVIYTPFIKDKKIKIPLVGLPDGLCLDTFLLADYKTGKKAWDQKRADETGQLTMYLLLIYIKYKIKPEKFKCFIHWLPTKEGGDFSISFREDPCVPVHFETKRTTADILEFCQRINDTYEAMQKYAIEHA